MKYSLELGITFIRYIIIYTYTYPLPGYMEMFCLYINNFVYLFWSKCKFNLIFYVISFIFCSEDNKSIESFRLQNVQLSMYTSDFVH